MSTGFKPFLHLYFGYSSLLIRYFLAFIKFIFVYKGQLRGTVEAAISEGVTVETGGNINIHF